MLHTYFLLSSVAMITGLTSVQSVANHVYNVFTNYKDDHGIIPTKENNLVVLYAVSTAMDLMKFLCLLLTVLFTKFLTGKPAIHRSKLEQSSSTLLD
jgi:membrane-bound metal-dependent hydrolase YbcI (DUF457 family)